MWNKFKTKLHSKWLIECSPTYFHKTVDILHVMSSSWLIILIILISNHNEKIFNIIWSSSSSLSSNHHLVVVPSPYDDDDHHIYLDYYLIVRPSYMFWPSSDIFCSNHNVGSGRLSPRLRSAWQLLLVRLWNGRPIPLKSLTSFDVGFMMKSILYGQFRSSGLCLVGRSKLRYVVTL